MKRDRAETIALQALGWLVAHDELGPAFLGATGATADDLRRGANDPAFLASVLEFLTSTDAWVIAFCDAHAQPYDAPLRARYALSGAESIHWT